MPEPTYARLDICPTEDLEWCFAATIRHKSTNRLSKGVPIQDWCPEDPGGMQVELDPDFPGVKLPDLIGNAQSLLILSLKAREAFADAGLRFGPCDVCGFTLINHKGRSHSVTYAFVNPHGAHDIAHPASEFLRYERSQKIYGCTRWVLDANLLTGLPDLVRAKDVPSTYFVSDRFVEVVRERELTNFRFIDVQHVAAR